MSMTTFNVGYLMTCTGTVSVEAGTLEEAEAKVREMPASRLGTEADSVEVVVLQDGAAEDGA